MTNINARLKAIRESHGYTQLEVALKTNTGYSIYRKMENSNTLPSIKTLLSLRNLYQLV